MTRLLLVRHAPTAATGVAFATDEPISDPAAPAGLAARLPAGATVLSSPKLRCRQTAEGAGLRPAIEPRLAECGFGRWEGIRFEDLDVEVASGWLSDPDAAPHGGESLSSLARRVEGWLDSLPTADQPPVVAFTHAGVIRAALVHALGAPLSSFWRVDVAPLSVVELRRAGGIWTVAL